MSDVRLVARGSGKESFIVTREQISELVDKAYERGQNGGLKPRAFECECDALQLNDWSGQQVARAKWLHIVTANHLRKARVELHDLRLDNEFANAELRLWRGSEHRKCDTPGHYAGDGYVTCSRAVESASVQDEVAPRSAMQMWWWMCAFKYVWRMWSKADPVADAEKAIDCLGHVAALLEEDADER